MANLITNRHKNQEQSGRPTPFAKRISSRRVRRKPIDDNEASERPLPHRPLKHAHRKRSGVCPICTTRLAKNAKGTRYVNRCDHCRSQLTPNFVANPVEQIAFGVDLKGNDAKAVGT